MNRKNNAFQKISNFITGKGFYLVILICVAAIALSGFYLIRSVNDNLSQLEDDQPVSGTADMNAPTPSPTPKVPDSTQTPLTTDDPQQSQPEPTPTPSAKEPEPEPSPSPTPRPAALVFTWPVNGSVISDFSVEALAYDVTMGDWRTHGALDIAASVGTQVRATAAGAVSEMYVDDLLGTTVVIDHGSGLVSVYSNLAAVPTVKVGDTVSTGTIIGSVGATAPAESGLDPHLHFAMLRDEKAVDPMDYLPEK